MGLFRKAIPLIDLEFLIWDDVENTKVTFTHPELKPIEYTILAIYQFAKVAYAAPHVQDDLLYTIKQLTCADENDLQVSSNKLLEDLRGINTEYEKGCSKFRSSLYFKSVIQRTIKTKIPFRLSQNRFLRTIPLAINLALEKATDFEKEVLIAAIPYQAKLYASGTDFRSIREFVNIPVNVYQYGLDNRKLDI
jgi:hypothetical protein